MIAVCSLGGRQFESLNVDRPFSQLKARSAGSLRGLSR